MDLKAARERIASQAPAGVFGHARPPGAVADFPAFVVGDPASIEYHSSYGGRTIVQLGIRVIVQRLGEQDSTDALDALLSTLPAQLEAITPAGAWSEFTVTGMAGGYGRWLQGGRDVGLAADLTATLVFI